MWRHKGLQRAVIPIGATLVAIILASQSYGLASSVRWTSSHAISAIADLDAELVVDLASLLASSLLQSTVAAFEFVARVILLDVVLLTLFGVMIWKQQQSTDRVIAPITSSKISPEEKGQESAGDITLLSDMTLHAETGPALKGQELCKWVEGSRIADVGVPQIVKAVDAMLEGGAVLSRTCSNSSSRSSQSGRHEGSSSSSSSSSEGEVEKHEVDAVIGLDATVDTDCNGNTGVAIYSAEGLTDVPATLSDSSRVTAVCHESDGAFPSVLVQLPMYNERAVFARGIAAACQLDWPRDRLLVQVLDDSTEEDISEGMKKEVAAWRAKGVNVNYRHRTDRKGFKAGNLREGLTEPYVEGYEYVAILDADFEPTPDWLRQSVPELAADPTLALVQTRWTFSNESEGGLLTRLQSIELTWHFLAEQLVSSSALGTFGFNGTAGIWRAAAIADAGSWRDDTTVEDMDLAVCAVQRGWRMKLLPHVECLSEVPASYSAYRKQQKRWTAGPANLLRRRAAAVLSAPGSVLGWHAKVYVLGVYVLLRRSVRHIVGMALWLLLLPLFFALYPYDRTASLPHASSALQGNLIICSTGAAESCAAMSSSLPLGATGAAAALSFWAFPWAMLLLTALPSLCLFAFSPKKILLLPAYCFFHGALLPLRLTACLSGLLDLSSSHTWDVTLKMGRRESAGNESAGLQEPGDNEEVCGGGQHLLDQVQPQYSGQRREIFMPELVFGIWVTAIACLGCVQGIRFNCADVQLWLPIVGTIGQGVWALWAGLGGLGAAEL